MILWIVYIKYSKLVSCAYYIYCSANNSRLSTKGLRIFINCVQTNLHRREIWFLVTRCPLLWLIYIRKSVLLHPLQSFCCLCMKSVLVDSDLLDCIHFMNFLHFTFFSWENLWRAQSLMSWDFLLLHHFGRALHRFFFLFFFPFPPSPLNSNNKVYRNVVLHHA